MYSLHKVCFFSPTRLNSESASKRPGRERRDQKKKTAGLILETTQPPLEKVQPLHCLHQVLIRSKVRHDAANQNCTFSSVELHKHFGKGLSRTYVMPHKSSSLSVNETEQFLSFFLIRILLLSLNVAALDASTEPWRHEMLVGVKAHTGFSSFLGFLGARFSPVKPTAWDGHEDAGWPWIIPQCEWAHRLSRQTHPPPLPAAPSALNLFDLLRNAKASGLNGRGTERLAGSWVGIICLTAPDVWISGGLFLTHESASFF